MYGFDGFVFDIPEGGGGGEVGIYSNSGGAGGGCWWRREEEEGTESEGVDEGDVDDHLTRRNVMSARAFHLVAAEKRGWGQGHT